MEHLNLDERVIKSIEDNNQTEINEIISQYTPFIINTISVQKNGYVSAENDDEFSIGLNAFYEAMQKYEKQRGHFLVFAKLVITSRLKTYCQKESRHKHLLLEDEQSDMIDSKSSIDNLELRDEINSFEKELMKFGLDFEMLADNTPKHRDTKENATQIGIKTSREEDLVNHLFKKKRLPISKMAERFFVSVKVIKKSKYYIMAVVIAIVKKFDLITSWIKIDKKGTEKND